MQSELLNYFRNDHAGPGLLLAEAPTGYGKTYQTVQAIYAYLKEGGTRRVLFVTTLLKICRRRICAEPMSRTDAAISSPKKCWPFVPLRILCWMP